MMTVLEKIESLKLKLELEREYSNIYSTERARVIKEEHYEKVLWEIIKKLDELNKEEWHGWD